MRKAQLIWWEAAEALWETAQWKPLSASRDSPSTYMYILTLPGRLDISRMGRREKNSASPGGDGGSAALGKLTPRWRGFVFPAQSLGGFIGFIWDMFLFYYWCKMTFFFLFSVTATLPEFHPAYVFFFFLLTDIVCCAFFFLQRFSRSRVSKYQYNKIVWLIAGG